MKNMTMHKVYRGIKNPTDDFGGGITPPAPPIGGLMPPIGIGCEDAILFFNNLK